MKIDTKEIEKINNALESIDGWKVEDFKIWEKKNGTGMATIRLTKGKEESNETKPLETSACISNGGNSTMSVGINIAEPNNKEYSNLYNKDDLE